MTGGIASTTTRCGSRCGMAESFHMLAILPLVREARHTRGWPGDDDEPRRARLPGQDDRPGLHPAWVVAAVAFVALVGAAAFRAVPGVLIEPLHDEFGWSHGHHLGPRSRSTSCCSA